MSPTCHTKSRLQAKRTSHNANNEQHDIATHSGGDQVDAVVDTTKGRHIDGLSSGNTSRADTRGVFARATVRHGVDQHLNRVLAGHDVDDLEGVLDNAHGHPSESHHEGGGGIMRKRQWSTHEEDCVTDRAYVRDNEYIKYLSSLRECSVWSIRADVSIERKNLTPRTGSTDEKVMLCFA